MGISENIKLLREQHQLSQKELGQIAGVSDKAVSTWEKGIKEPRMGAIQKMADYFGIQKSNIIEDDGMITKPIQQLAPTKEELTPAEKQHLDKYRQLIPDNKTAIDCQMDFMLYQQALEVKKQSCAQHNKRQRQGRTDTAKIVVCEAIRRQEE